MSQLKDRLSSFLGRKPATVQADNALVQNKDKKNKTITAISVDPKTSEPETGNIATLVDEKEATLAVEAKAGPYKPVQPSAANQVKVEDERSMAMAGTSFKFEGTVLTAEGGPLKVPEESRNYCALFDNGLWIVSASHRRSPIVTSVEVSAKRQGYKVDPARYVSPSIIGQAYNYASRQLATSQYDHNAIRRKAVYMIECAVAAGANDIHIEAVNNRTRIDFRIDGALRPWESWTQREGEQLLSSIYSHSIGQSGATANWQEPQAAMLTSAATGKDAIILPKGVISVRCQWVPLSDGGRYLDMRLQYDSAHLFGENFVMADVDSLGFSQEQLKVIQSLRALPGGMRIFSGPVNQGKTTTLRVTLNRRMSETNMQLNCLLIEDPPEGGIIGARQIGVSASVKDEQRERAFIEIMRCALRLDPDIIMLGEIRDIQTAKFAFRLALTGRQVYTTGHVYAAMATPKRLRDIGIEPYIVYDPHLVRGMICQRLLRTMCMECRIPLAQALTDMGPMYKDLARRLRAGLSHMDASRSKSGRPGQSPMERLSEPDLRHVYLANEDGCSKCFKGRAGRTICAEVVETDAKLMELLQDNRMIEADDYWLSPHGLNGLTMLWHGMEKVRRGEVSPNDAEFELGPFIRERELIEVEQHLGAMP
jgi:type II secretory ATPase GspE/PulE/Tfp pilus assembly ATPase PilB-like protein